MAEKTKIAASLGEERLALPGLVNAALAANDRVKYYFTLLQAARSHADRPDRPASDLRRERIASGVAESRWDAVPEGAASLGDGRYRIPGAGEIVRTVASEVDVMLRPLARHDGFAQRFAALDRAKPEAKDDVIKAAEVDALASGSRERGDSLHLLVMDAHKALNELQREIAAQVVDGASVYGLKAPDLVLVRAFMRGVRRTAPLKFDHPGLGTTATRMGNRLLLQNDIGTTDAHVLVVHVEERRVTVTYTDVHLQRLLFFRGLLARFPVEWGDTVTRSDATMDDGVYHMSVGILAAADDAQVRAYLEFLGSRLVFLIDWNRARKRLRALVSKSAAVSLLAWAADHDYGHMAFLKAGGEQLIYEALDFVLKGESRFGERLDEVLGADEASDYLRFVLKACSTSLTQGEPPSIVQDMVRVELLGYFRTGRQRVYDIAAEHAALMVEIAGAVRDSVMHARAVSTDREALQRNAARAKGWESLADEAVNRARAAAEHSGAAESFGAIVAAADDSADELEEAAFRLTLVPSPLDGTAPPVDLQPLAELLVQATQEYVKLVETSRHVRRGGAREDMQDFLDAVHRVMALERATDDAQRELEGRLVKEAPDFRSLHVLSETMKNLEQAADALMHCSLRMRDFVLGQVMAS